MLSSTSNEKKKNVIVFLLLELLMAFFDHFYFGAYVVENIPGSITAYSLFLPGDTIWTSASIFGTNLSPQIDFNFIN